MKQKTQASLGGLTSIFVKYAEQITEAFQTATLGAAPECILKLRSTPKNDKNSIRRRQKYGVSTESITPLVESALTREYAKHSCVFSLPSTCFPRFSAHCRLESTLNAQKAPMTCRSPGLYDGGQLSLADIGFILPKKDEIIQITGNMEPIGVTGFCNAGGSFLLLLLCGLAFLHATSLLSAAVFPAPVGRTRLKNTVLTILCNSWGKDAGFFADQAKNHTAAENMRQAGCV